MSTIAAEPNLAFAGYLLDARKQLLIGPDGVPVNISSRAFETLYVLASHPHELLDKQRLMKAVWPNSVVEENNLNQQIATLRKIFGETAGDHRFIVTVSRRGYRFVQDVQRVDSLPFAARRLQESSGPAAGNGSADDSPSRNVLDAVSPRGSRALRRGAMVAAVVVLMVGAAYVLLAGRESGRAIPIETPSIAVLPFTDGDRLRITAQLLDAADGSQLWAETYDRRLGDVFTIQQQIADSVAATLQRTFRPARGAATAGGTRNVEAYEAYLSARAVTNNGGSSRANEAIGLLERSVRLDPDFALAWAALAEAYTFAVDFPPASALSLTPVELQQRISRAALRAFELAPDAPETLRSAGMVSMQNRDWAEAERRLRRAVELAGPYDYDANLLYALFLMNVGRASEAIPYAERAMRAEPLLLRPVAFRAALYEMRGELDKAEALLLASADLGGHEAMRREGLIMISLARHDQSGLTRLLPDGGDTRASRDDPAAALEDLRRSYADATRSGAYGQHIPLVPVALFASFLGDHALSLDALRALGPTQNLHALWRPALREVRRVPGFEELVRELGLVDYWRATGNWGEFCGETGSGGIMCR